MNAASMRARGKKTRAAFEPPSADKRFEQLEVTMKRHQYRQDALIEVLHAAQKLFGFLEAPVLHFVAHHLKLPPSRVYGVATFYHLFTLTPRGRHTCIVCTGTACYVKGADKLLASVSQAASVEAGQTTADGELTLRTVRCLEPCGIAPVAVLDGAVHGHETPEKLLEQVKGWLPRGTVRSA
ncbi:MAG TPA: bidirectional hydrogenase complex protein HoxE [Gemmataceae bacterium]|nr:bidirectional hydrogenase complex protein HoxE [Gemmataceae bacterium]